MQNVKCKTQNYNLKLKTFRFLIAVLPFTFYLLTLIGCVTVPTHELAIPTYNINGINYLSLVSLCDLKNINWDYDTFTKKITLKKESKEIILLANSSIVLVDGIAKDLKYPVETYKGILVVPCVFKSDVIDILFKPYYPKERPALPYITQIRKIVIDPGHGGKDPGAIGRMGVREKDICLDTAKRLRPILESFGFEVFLTREYDKYVSLEERAKVANRRKADLFISVHANANRVRSLSGFEVYYVSGNVDDSRRSLISAENADLSLGDSSFVNKTMNIKATVWDIIYGQNRNESVELARHICKYASNNLNTNVLGVKGAPFYVLKWTQMPSILIEVGFLSNLYEERLLRNGFYRQQLAETIAGGIRSYSQDYTLTCESQR